MTEVIPENSPSVRSQNSSRITRIRTLKKEKNPFIIPSNESLPQRKQELIARNSLLYSGISTISPRTNFRKLTLVSAPSLSNEEKALKKIILSPESYEDKEGLKQFIEQKREIFLAQLAIDTKKEELKRIARYEREEEESLKEKSKDIEEFQDQFNKYLQNDSSETMLARQAAEAKSKERIQVSLQIKQISTQISSLRSEISHHEERKDECEHYKQFLESLTPPDWRAANPLPEIYFKRPQQLLDQYQSLEEENLFLIRHCQEAEEIVERCREQFNLLLDSRDCDIVRMRREEQEQKALYNQSKDFNNLFQISSQFRHGNELSSSEYHQLHHVVSLFHHELGFDATTRTDVVVMLRRIENIMDNVIMKIKQYNPQSVAKEASKREKQRREQERATNQKLKNDKQQEKTLKALAAANLPIFRKTTRPLIKRTIPFKGESRESKEEKERQLKLQEEADQQLLYGFTWD